MSGRAPVPAVGMRLPPAEAWRMAAAGAARFAEVGRFNVTPLDHAYMDRPLIESLIMTVQQHPGRIAVVDANRQLTYRQFWNLAAQYAHTVAAANAPPGPIALLLRDRTASGAALFAGLATGRPAVLLDRAHPPERNRELINSADAALVIVQAGDRDAIAAAGTRRVLDMPEPSGAEPAAALSLLTRRGVDEPAFILPTSGSTGQPKLVVHSQRTEAYRVSQFADASRLTQHDRFMYCGGPPTSYSGLGCLLSTLRCGGEAHLIDMRSEGISGLLRRLTQAQITMLLAGASLLRNLVDLPGARGALSHLRLLATGGEALLHADIDLIRPLLPVDCVLQTGYGATETTNLRWTIPLHDTRDPFRVPVGYPNLGGDFLILDDDGSVCPPGSPGELVVRSRYNALGEWQSGRCVPGRLIPDPEEPDQRIYFTGDVARQSADGIYVILGRKDRQVKINGQRVEPMEIEAALRAAPGVVDAVVLARTDGASTALLAFVAAGAQATPALGASLRQGLQGRLPSYMVPSRIEVMADLPRLPGGKVDGVALLARGGR